MAFRIGIIHGWGSASDLRNRLEDAVCRRERHLFWTYPPAARKLKKNGLFWFNPGSVFKGRGQFRGSVGVVHVEQQLRGEIITFIGWLMENSVGSLAHGVYIGEAGALLHLLPGRKRALGRRTAYFAPRPPGYGNDE